MPASMIARVGDALGDRPLDATLAWPARGEIGRSSLHRLVEQGVRSVVLNSTAVRVGNPEGAALPGFTRLRSAGVQVAAALTSPVIERDAANALTEGGAGLAALPDLMAELAVRATTQPDVEHPVTITAPRYVDPDVATAVRTLEDTSRSIFATPISLVSAVADPSLLGSAGYGRLATAAASLVADPPPTLLAADSAVRNLRLVRSLLDVDNDPAAAALVASIPPAIQRAESTAWSAAGNESAATDYAMQLDDEFSRIETGVHIVKPSSNSYTLASNNSPLPITVSNELPYAVHVRIEIVAVNTSGFVAQSVDDQPIEAKQTKTIYVPATTERAGRIKIEVLLQAPNHDPLNDPVTLTVRSTALGVIGVIITVVAGVVLGIALLWRLFRRIRGGRTAARRPTRPVSA
jgi:hypothetical protein